jgi:hypothetical protein
MGFDFDTFRDRVLAGAGELTAGAARETADAARRDAAAFLADTRSKFERWGRALAAGELARDEFELLVRARRSNMEMQALVAAGTTRQAVDDLRERLVALAVDAAFDVVF